MYPFPKDEAVDDGMPVTVVFRKWKTGGAAVALFPFVPAAVTNASEDPECMAYEHVGQYGAAEYFTVIHASDRVDTDNADDLAAQTKLFDALVTRGYDMEVFTHEEVMQEVGFKHGQREAERLGSSPVL